MSTSNAAGASALTAAQHLHEFLLRAEYFPNEMARPSAFSLADGRAGETLFLAECQRVGLESRVELRNAVSDLLNALEHTPMHWGFMSGLTGILWTLRCLQQNPHVDDSRLDLISFEDTEGLILQALSRNLQSDYDLVGGLVGIGGECQDSCRMNCY